MARNIILCNNCGGAEHLKLLNVRGNRGVSFISKVHTVVVCSECGLVFLNPQHDKEDYDKFYSGLNVKKIQKELVLRKINQKNSGRGEVRDFLTDILKKEGAPSHIKLLDVGCGNGIFLSLLKDTGWDLEGLEPGTAEVDFARKELNLKVHKGVLMNNTLPSNSYDVVTMLAVIEHVTDPLWAIKKLGELTKPGGYLLLTTPSFRHQELRKGIGNYYKFVHTFYFTEKTLGSIMRQAGFDIKAVHIKKAVGNVGGGVLFMIGKKTNRNTSYEKENVDELMSIFKEARRRTFVKRLLFMLKSYFFAASRRTKRIFSSLRS